MTVKMKWLGEGAWDTAEKALSWQIHVRGTPTTLAAQRPDAEWPAEHYQNYGTEAKARAFWDAEVAAGAEIVGEPP